MKKTIRKAIALAMVLTLALTAAAQADTIVSPSFRLPTAGERPTEVPTVEPTAEPIAEPTEEPTVEPTEVPTEEPTEEPTAEPTEEPLPEPVLSVTSNLAGKTSVASGTEMVLTLLVEGADGYAYTIQWQQSNDGGATWTDVPNANSHELRLILTPEHSGMYWRACVDILSPEAE